MLLEPQGFGSPYRYWADCGPGSTVTTEDRRIIAPGITMISTVSMTLSAVDVAKATVDMVVRNRVEGAPVDLPPTETLQEIEIPAEPGDSPEDGAAETIVGGGRDIACRRFEWTVDGQGGPALKVRSWLSREVPGGMVRSEMLLEGTATPLSTSTVLSFLKKDPPTSART